MSGIEVKRSSLERFRPFLVPILVVGLALISAFYLVLPKIPEVANNRQEIKKEKIRLAKLTAKAVALEGLDQVELGERVRVISAALPSEKNLPLLMATIRRLAENNHVSLVSFQVSPGKLDVEESKKERLFYLDFSLQISGQKDDVKEFFADSAWVLPLMKVKSASFTAMDPDILKVKLPLASPYLYFPSTLGSVEEPLKLLTVEENLIYQKISKFEKNPVSEGLKNVPAGKANPFAF